MVNKILNIVRNPIFPKNRISLMFNIIWPTTCLDKYPLKSFKIINLIYTWHGKKLNFFSGQEKTLPTLHKSLNCARVQYTILVVSVFNPFLYTIPVVSVFNPLLYTILVVTVCRFFYKQNLIPCQQKSYAKGFPPYSKAIS